jgi:integrase/recombinase XerC
MPRRSPKSNLSPQAQSAFDAYSHYLKESVDLRPATIRNYLSDLRQFIAWFEREPNRRFQTHQVTTPTLTAYRLYLKDDLDRKPSTINRHLVTLKRYFAWTTERGEIARDPAKPVRLVGEESNTPRAIASKMKGCW